MKKLVGFVFLLLLGGLPCRAQRPIMQQHCYSQACLFSSWYPNGDGDLLVAVIEAGQIGQLPCESEPQQCGMGGYFSVIDFAGNTWQRAYNSNECQLWFALNAKPVTNFVGVFATHGFDYPPQNIHAGGDFDYNVVILDYPPSTGLDSVSPAQNLTDNNNNAPSAGPVTASTNNTLLIGWTINLAFNNSMGPLTMTPSNPQFQVLTDDGYVAVVACVVQTPGPYSFSATYNGNALWGAGLAAFKMGSQDNSNEIKPKSEHEPKKGDPVSEKSS